MSEQPVPPSDPAATPAQPGTTPVADSPAVPPLPSVSELDVEELQTALRSMRQMVNLALVGLIVVFASVNVILLQQVALLRGQVVELSRSSQQMITFLEDHRTNGAPQFVAFIREMQKAAARNPQFAQVLARFPQFQISGPPTNQPSHGTQSVKF